MTHRRLRDAMKVEAHELGPYRPPSVSEMQVLAAIERAQRHCDRVVFHYEIAEHLGFEQSSATTRRLRPQLEALRADGSLASERRDRSEVWPITRRGRGRLAAARRRGTVEPLPESPQHRTWRHARETAIEHLEEICGAVLAALAEADEVLGGSEKPPGDSTSHFEVGERLQREFAQLGIAIHCLREWPEPDDARRDVDIEVRHRGRRGYRELKERRR